MIVILNDYIRGVVANEETFWSRLEDELSDAVAISTAKLTVPLDKMIEELKPDLVIQNANCGKLTDCKTVSFLQDPLIEMQKLFEPFTLRIRLKIRNRQSYSDRLQLQRESFNHSIKVTNSNFMANMYHKTGEFRVIPMGVDHELFRPMEEKKELRKKYNLPDNKTIKIFVGSTHEIKGFKQIKKMVSEDTASFWILVLKDVDIGAGSNFRTFYKISQDVLAELYNCSDLLVARSLVESFGLATVEAMFCNVPVDVTNTGIFWDWEPDMDNPRDAAFKKGLDKSTWMKNWSRLVDEHITN